MTEKDIKEAKVCLDNLYYIALETHKPQIIKDYYSKVYDVFSWVEDQIENLGENIHMQVSEEIDYLKYVESWLSMELPEY